MKWLALITILMMSGCSSFSSLKGSDTVPVTPSQTSAATAVQASATISVPVKARVSDVTRTDALIKTLDAAGCDFSGVHITEAVVRKGSSTLIITCK